MGAIDAQQIRIDCETGAQRREPQSYPGLDKPGASIYENIFLKFRGRKHTAKQYALFSASNVLSHKSCEKNNFESCFFSSSLSQ